MILCPHCRRPKTPSPGQAQCGCRYLIAQPFQGRKVGLKESGKTKYRFLSSGYTLKGKEVIHARVSGENTVQSGGQKGSDR